MYGHSTFLSDVLFNFISYSFTVFTPSLPYSVIFIGNPVSLSLFSSTFIFKSPIFLLCLIEYFLLLLLYTTLGLKHHIKFSKSFLLK